MGLLHIFLDQLLPLNDQVGAGNVRFYILHKTLQRKTKATLVSQKSKASSTKLMTCQLGCKKKYPRLARHYMRQKHDLSKEEAERLARQPMKTKTEGCRIRRICPLCGLVTCKMFRHLRNKNIHTLSEDQITHYNRLAIRFQETTTENVTPAKAQSKEHYHISSATPSATPPPPDL